MKTFSLLLFSLIFAASCFGREIKGRIIDFEKNPIADASVIFSEGDSIIGLTYSDNAGNILFSCENVTPLSVTIEAFGYEREEFVLDSNMDSFSKTLTKSLKEVDLEEYTVVADMSKVVKRLANGNRFFLSPKAKKMKDPFMALKEIPTLISDPFNASITTLNGEKPLILIDGMEINSGIKPILPSDIESVDVIDAIPAKYLARGITSIVNIRLRKNRPPYIWTEFATRHEFPVRNGFGVGYFEVGNEKLSLYGRAVANYTHHDDSEGDITRENSGYSQSYEWSKRNNQMYYIGELQLKYAPSKNDYLAVQAYEKYTKSHSRQNGEGKYITGYTQNYASFNDSHDDNSVFTSSAYYKHLFSESVEFEATAGYNNNHNKLTSDGWEKYGSEMYDSKLRFKNRRNSGNLDLTFSKDYDNGNSLKVGSSTTLLSDQIRDLSQPVFKHSNYDEYLYGTFTGQAKALNYMISLGVEATWLKAGNSSNRYFRPRGTVSTNYQFNSHNSLQLYYTLSNESPEVSKLNPYNTSTDSLYVTRGNPYLTPQNTHDLSLTYEFNKGPFYLSYTAGGTLNTDLITASGFTDSDGIYTSTYENMGKYRQIYSSIYASWRFGNDDCNASIYGGGNWTRKLYEGYSPKDCFRLNLGVNAWVKKFYFGSQFSLNPREYTDITIVKNLRPIMANVQVNYSITENLYIALCLQGFTGNMKSRTFTENGTFRSVSYTKFSETGFHPWILIRWNMRKNAKRKIKLGNLNFNEEKGISL